MSQVLESLESVESPGEHRLGSPAPRRRPHYPLTKLPFPLPPLSLTKSGKSISYKHPLTPLTLQGRFSVKSPV